MAQWVHCEEQPRFGLSKLMTSPRSDFEIRLIWKSGANSRHASFGRRVSTLSLLPPPSSPSSKSIHPSIHPSTNTILFYLWNLLMEIVKGENLFFPILREFCGVPPGWHTKGLYCASWRSNRMRSSQVSDTLPSDTTSNPIFELANVVLCVCHLS